MILLQACFLDQSFAMGDLFDSALDENTVVANTCLQLGLVSQFVEQRTGTRTIVPTIFFDRDDNHLAFCSQWLLRYFNLETVTSSDFLTLLDFFIFSSELDAFVIHADIQVGFFTEINKEFRGDRIGFAIRAWDIYKSSSHWNLI